MKRVLLMASAGLLSWGLTTFSAAPADLVHLSGLLNPVLTLEQFQVLCSVDQPDFLERPTPVGWTVLAYAKHMKEEIISGLTGEEVKIIIQSAAEVALDKARRQMQIISKGDPRIDAAQLKANVRSWCNTVATPFIRSVLVLHDQHHDLWDQAITQAKQNNSH